MPSTHQNAVNKGYRFVKIPRIPHSDLILHRTKWCDTQLVNNVYKNTGEKLHCRSI